MAGGYSIRKIELQDFHGVVSALNVLTTVGPITKEDFASTIKHWNACKIANDIPVYNPYVIVEDASGEVAATGNLIIEKKLIHGCAICGHIEDIAVSEKHQGKKLGKMLIEKLTEVGLQAGCYKIILDCDEKNVKFYEKCGYSRAGIEMQIRK